MFGLSHGSRADVARWLMIGSMAIPMLPIAATAQVTLSKPDTALTQKHKHLFNHRDAYIAVGMTATMFALFPEDKHIAAELRDSATQANRFFGTTAKTVEEISTPGAYIIGAGLYVAGRLGNMPKLADLGWHGSAAL